MRYKAIHRNVLLVVRLRREGTWKCYVVPVPGLNHDMESQELWQSDGSQLPEDIARIAFPEYHQTPYAQ